MDIYKLYNLIDILYNVGHNINIEHNILTNRHSVYWVMFDKYDFYLHKTKYEIDTESFYHNDNYYTIISNDDKILNNEVNNIYTKLIQK